MQDNQRPPWDEMKWDGAGEKAMKSSVVRKTQSSELSGSEDAGGSGKQGC